MRFYKLLALQDIVLYILPTLVFLLIFGLALSFRHWMTEDAEERKERILYRFPDGIEDRNAPFPLSLALTIAGALIWGFFYILWIGVMGVRI
jgi:hypothetical protein